MGWLDKLLHSQKEEPEKPETVEHAEKKPVEELRNPVHKNEEHLEKEEKSSDAKVDPLVQAIERREGKIQGALQELSRKVEFNDDADLTLVYFRYAVKITDEGIAKFLEVESLEALDITDTAITNDGFEHLAAMPNLTELICDVTEIGDDGLRHFAENLTTCFRRKISEFC